jgi:hypothetical protein
MSARMFTTGRGGVIEMPVLNWRKIADRTFEMDFSPKDVPPGDWDVWVQDPVLQRRQSERMELYKAATGPTNLRIGAFHPLDEWDEDAWDSISVVCDEVVDATGYTFEIKDLDAEPGEEPVSHHEVAPATDLRGGRVTSGAQLERRYEVRALAKVNGEESGWTNPIVINTGFPAFILKEDLPLLQKAIPITTRDQVAVRSAWRAVHQS